MNLLNKLVVDNGFTVSLTGKDVPTVGYVCGGLGSEFVKSLEEFTELDILKFVLDNAELLKNALLGGWLNDGNVYLDVCQIFSNLEVAKLVGKEKNQKALYDLTEGKDILL